MSPKPRLELTWTGKENRPRLEPRILLEDPERSYHAPHRVSASHQGSLRTPKGCEAPSGRFLSGVP